MVEVPSRRRLLRRTRSFGRSSWIAKAIRAAVEAVKRVGKGAGVSLDIWIEPTGANAVGFSAEVSTKLPKEPPYKGVFFYNETNDLFRNNPTQPDLALKTVESDQGAEPLKTVEGAA